MEKENIITNIGTIDIPSITFDMEEIPVVFNISKITSELMEKIWEAVEAEKMMNSLNNFEADDSVWGEKGIKVCFTYLSAVISATGDSRYCVIAGFNDLEKDSLESEVCVEIDLTEYDHILREIIIQAMASRFVEGKEKKENR